MASRNGEQESLKKKVAKVREVVSTVSTNDIVLALHSFDLDVEKTIRALCEQDVTTVIGDWETTKHAPVKKNRKQRRLELNSQKSQPNLGKGSIISSSTTNTTINSTTTGPAPTLSTVPVTTIPSKVPGQQKVTLPPPGPKSQPVTSTINSNQVKNKQHQGKDSPISTSASDIENIFKQIRQALTERERYLLTQVKSHPTQYFNIDPSNLLSIINNFGQLSSINNKSNIISSPSSSRPNSNNSLKNATSHSSLVSSVGDDSGLGQVSPISVKGKQQSSITGTATVAINEGGINMESDSFSVDQLAEIQRKLQETLSAQGIDISLVQSMSENTSSFVNRSKQNQQDRQRQSKMENSNSKHVGKNKLGKGIQA